MNKWIILFLALTGCSEDVQIPTYDIKNSDMIGSCFRDGNGSSYFKNIGFKEVNGEKNVMVEWVFLTPYTTHILAGKSKAPDEYYIVLFNTYKKIPCREYELMEKLVDAQILVNNLQERVEKLEKRRK